MLTVKRRPIQEVAPWLTSVTPELILNKDGSLLASFQFAGVDADSPHADDISAARTQLDLASRSFDHRITAWWRLSHRRATSYIDGSFAANADARLDALHRTAMTSGKYFQNGHALFLALTPETGMGSVFDKVRYHMTVGGRSAASAMIEAAKDTLFARHAFAFDLARVRAEARRFESVLDAFVGGLPSLKLQRLALQDSYAALHQCANPGGPSRRIRPPVTLLDTHLTETDVTVGSDQLIFESANGKRHAAIVAVKEWMNFQEAALDRLLQLDAELDVCILFRHLDTARAAGHIEKVRRFYKMASLDLRGILQQYLANEEAEADEGREALAKEASRALSRLTAEGVQYGFANISVVVYGQTQQACEEAVSEVIGTLTNAGFGAIRERTNLMAAWNSTLPGRWDCQRRLQFVETPAVSDLAPLCSVASGPTGNRWLSDKAGRAVPPLTCVPTRHRTAQRVDLHQAGGNAHLLVIGPIGAGKSVFLNFLVSQAGRHDARRIRFDKDRSTRIPTLLADGTFVDITGRFQGATSINPLSLLVDTEHFAYLTEWLMLAVEDESFTASSQQRQDVFEAIKILSSYDRQHWTLTKLSTLLRESLRERLQIWLRGGQYGHFFDHVDDAFTVGENMCIEMGHLLETFPRAAALFTDYAFYRISQSMDGVRYTLIEVEEAGFFFQQPQFYQRLESWITTIRKRNGAIWMATQSLRQLERLPGFEILKDNIGNIIYLPNSQAASSKDLYRDTFGLTETQIRMITEAVPNRDYLWVSRSQARMLQLTFSEEMLAMLRSDGAAQVVFDRHHASGEPNWQDHYVREMLARTC